MRFLKRIQERRTKRIGVFSLVSGCGATHLAISIANYYASKERRTVLYVECEKENGLIEINKHSGGIMALRTKRTAAAQGVSGFERDGVLYMPSVSQEDAHRLLAENKEVILTEVPDWAPGSCLRSGMFDRTFLVLSAKPWKYPAAESSLDQIIALNNGMVQGDCVCFGLTKTEEKKLAADFGQRCTEIPMIRDPFCLAKEDIRFLKKLLE